MSADGVFAQAVEIAQKEHDRACKCKTKATLSGKDGPNLVMLMAAMHVAEAVDREMTGKGSMEQVLSTLETYRVKRRAF